MLPAQNSTGNWVKIVQRIPVRLAIDNPDPELSAARRHERDLHGRYPYLAALEYRADGVRAETEPAAIAGTE